MKKINNQYVPSATDIKKAAAHCRAIARRAAYDGSVEAWLNQSTGTISYNEIVGNGWTEGGDDWKFLASAYTPARG